MYSSCKFQFFDLLKRLLLSSAFDLLSTDFLSSFMRLGKYVEATAARRLSDRVVLRSGKSRADRRR